MDEQLDASSHIDNWEKKWNELQALTPQPHIHSMDVIAFNKQTQQLLPSSNGL